MSNEDLIEEILYKSYELGVNDQVFEKVKELIETHDKYDAYMIAFHEISKELDIHKESFHSN